MEKQLSSERTFKYIKTNNKTFCLLDHFRPLAIFLLILIPLLHLYNYFNKLAEDNGFINEELVKEQLLSEMNRFQDDLNPEKYIEKAFLDLESKFGIPDLNDTQYKYSFDDKNRPYFLTKGFIGKAKYYLKSLYGFEPFIFISSGYDFTDTEIDDKDKVLNVEEEKTKFLYSCIGSILYINNPSEGFIKLKPLDPKNIDSFNTSLNKIFVESDLFKFGYNFKNTFFIQMLKQISVFFQEMGKPSHCSVFFTNSFGNQNVYQYYNCLINRGTKEDCFLGLYYTLTRNTDISIEVLLNKALKLNSRNDSVIKRNITNTKVKTPKWGGINEKEIKYEAPFPSHFYNFISEHKNKNENTYKFYYDYLNAHSLCVSIDKAKINNEYLLYKKIVESVFIFLIIFYLLYLIYSSFITESVRIPLSLKVRIIVLIAVSVPIIGFWVITYLGMRNEERIILSRTERIISERLALFDKIKEDYLNNFTIELLNHKKILADNYYSYNKNNLFYECDKDNDFVSSLKRGESFSQIILLDKYGKNTGWGVSKKSNGEIDYKQLLYLYKYLLDMNMLDQSTPENKKNYGQYIIMSTFMDSYLKSYNSKNILAKECFLIPSEGMRIKDKVSYQLLSPASNPICPSVLVYNYIYLSNLIDMKLNKIINEKYSELLSQTTDFAQIKYAIFSRKESDFRERIHQMRVFPFRHMHLDSVKKAMTKRNSGSEIEEKNNNYYIKTWKYYNDVPVIFVAGAIVSKSQLNMLTDKILGLILIIYALLVVSLLSDFFSRALLEPIRTLSKFVKEISYGHVNVKINMKTGDEMEELGDSFNIMSDGLCEREKLKRFVSDKLFSSLEKADKQEIAKANVTILSSDIRSFTTISEKNEPEKVVSLLNDYFTLMEESIVKYGGSIEKIVGDAISAAFYEDKNPDYALNACKAALEMRESLKHFNEERKAKGLFTIENGIGLASGSVMIGFAGIKARRREFLLMGNIIKSAEGLESMTKQAVSSKVFIDKQTYDFVKDKVNFCPENSSSDTFYREILL